MADSASPDGENLHYRVRREASGALARLGAAWREKRWLRWLGYLAGAGVLFVTALWILVGRDLPSTDKLLTYQPPLPTIVRGVDGQIVYSYARERRVQLRFVDFPKPLIDAFLSAEDKTF